MAKTYKVTLGPNAYSFTDQSTGISICKGQVKELSQRQYNTRRVRNALQSNHLVMVIEDNDAKKYTEQDIEKLIKKVKANHKAGMEVAKAAKGYSIEEIKLIAPSFDIEVEDTDTVEDILTLIFTNLDDEAEKKA